MCNNECISEGICKHNEECYDDLCFTSEQMKVVDKWLAENRNKTIEEIIENIIPTLCEYNVDDEAIEQCKRLLEQMKGEQK